MLFVSCVCLSWVTGQRYIQPDRATPLYPLMSSRENTPAGHVLQNHIQLTAAYIIHHLWIWIHLYVLLDSPVDVTENNVFKLTASLL